MDSSGYVLLMSVGLWILSGQPIRVNTPEETTKIRFHGVKVKVTNIEQGKEFYSNRLGLKDKDDRSHPEQPILETGSLPLILEAARFPHKGPVTSNIAFQVNKLLPAVDRFRKRDVSILEETLSRNGIGIHINFEDPFGNIHSLLEVQIRPVKPFKEPRIYNAGFRINDMERAEEFYVEKLGFVVLSRNYLPNALPLVHSDESFAFMLHYNKSLPSKKENTYPDEAQTLLIFVTQDLREGTRLLEKQGVELVFKEPKYDSLGRYVAFKDPFGNVSELYELKK